MDKKKRIIYTVFVLVWMAVVFYFSHQNGTKSSDLSNGIVNRIILYITGGQGVSQEILVFLNAWIRKLAHLTIYLIGGFLIANDVVTYVSAEEKTIMLSIGIGFFYAITDELHQFFVGGRSARIEDVGIDTLGVLIGVLVFILFQKWIKSRKKI